MNFKFSLNPYLRFIFLLIVVTGVLFEKNKSRKKKERDKKYMFEAARRDKKKYMFEAALDGKIGLELW